MRPNKHLQTDTITVWHGDSIATMRELPDNSIDSIVTDPPYGLSSITPDQIADVMVKWSTGHRDYMPQTRGFMGKSWDGFVPPPALWDEAMRVLKPGGHLLAFAGSRTHDLMGMSIRLAGFDIRDSVAWLTGSGFPKSHDVGKSTGDPRWDGWGTALKPAHEPVTVARKPFKGTVAQNVLSWGTGALNIDATRIGTESTQRNNTAEMGYHGGNLAAEYQTGSTAGRWPANVVLDDTTAELLDEQSGNVKGAVSNGRKAGNGAMFDPGAAAQAPSYGDSGGASRFFYVAKAPKRERPVVDGVAHPTVKPLALMRWLVKLVTPPGGVVLDPFAGSGTTLEACLLEGFDHVGIEREAEYLPLIEARLDRQAGTLPTAA